MFHMFDQQKNQILFCLPNVVNCWGDKTFPRKSWYFIVTAQALYYKDEFVFLNRLWGWFFLEDCQLFRPRFQKSAMEFILPFGMKCFEGFLKRSMVIQNPYIIFIIPRVLKTNVSQKVQWWLPSDAFGWAFKGDDMFPGGRLGLKSWCKHVKFVS